MTISVTEKAYYSGGGSYSFAATFNEVAPANATTEWNVPGMQIGWDSVDGGIMLGNWELRARWPA